MTSTSDWIGIFNNQFHDMLRDLMTVFPDDPDFQFFHSAGGLLMRTQPRSIPQMFHANVTVKFGPAILKQDDAFLLQQDYSEYTHDDWSNMLVSKLKRYWSSLSAENREIIWKYLHILVKLDGKIYPSA